MNQMKQSKVPKSWPTWLVKCMWRGTAIKLLIPAKDEDHAWDLASKQVKKLLGGMSCLEIKVMGTV